jgi:hypothetical protein
MDASKRIEVGPFVATRVHLNRGWVWWARWSYRRGGTNPHAADAGGDDARHGLNPHGYDDVGAARRAMVRASAKLEGR